MLKTSSDLEILGKTVVRRTGVLIVDPGSLLPLAIYLSTVGLLEVVEDSAVLTNLCLRNSG